MKKLFALATILPLLGCSNLDDDTLSNRTKKTAPAAVIERNNQVKMQNINSTGVLNEMIPIQAKQSKPANVNPKKASQLLNVPLIRQNPELRYGCEVTSLTMVLQYAGVKTDKMELYRLIKKDSDPLVKTNGDIRRWGNPAEGFVGDMTGKTPGYAVFDRPMVQLINQKLPGRAINLTNQTFERVLQHVSDGYPVVVWTTGDYRLPDRWESWYHGQQYIKTPLDLHAVVLVGYDRNFVYLNDPLSGRKQVRVGKDRFISSWKALNCRAVSYK
ncbi:C39 family peptidase [Bacillus salipaludis]|uniref:C39 family peptidase n=1 Tax=Bacillus salipaludis TaxID=2547811 RepID=A0AA90QXC3_9BACI|nr:C39 family peptidase [Bacillus salipaludis]MDQ6596782.1 C39 family peptidase [Bacillus salipaludis]